MRKLIFVGPSINSEYRESLNKKEEFLIRPPIQAGDIWKVLSEEKDISHILIIDGYFYTKLSVLHKEILSAINQNKNVIGAASMGALRAKELNSYGMIGFGEVYDFYNQFPHTGDDEVGILHTDDMQYKNLSIPLINLRILLNKKEFINHKMKLYLSSLINKLEKVAFPKRTWQYINNITLNEFSIEYLDFPNLLKKDYFDYKSEDALKAIESLINNKFSNDLIFMKKISSNTNGIKNSYKELDLSLFSNSLNSKKMGIQSFISFLRINSFFNEKDIALSLFKKLIVEKYQNEIFIEEEFIEKEIDKLSSSLGIVKRNQLTSKLGLSEKELENIIRDKLIFSRYLRYKTDDLGIAITNDLLFDNLISNNEISDLKDLKELKSIDEYKTFIRSCLDLNNKLGSFLSFKFFFAQIKKEFKKKWEYFLINRNIDIITLFKNITEK